MVLSLERTERDCREEELRAVWAGRQWEEKGPSDPGLSRFRYEDGKIRSFCCAPPLPKLASTLGLGDGSVDKALT